MSTPQFHASGEVIPAVDLQAARRADRMRNSAQCGRTFRGEPQDPALAIRMPAIAAWGELHAIDMP